jgi:hypothetical protein
MTAAIPGQGFFEAKFAPLMINDPEGGISNVSLTLVHRGSLE